MPEQLGLDLRAYLRVVLQGWRIITAAAMLGMALAALVTLRTPATYSSSVTFFVTTPGTGSNSPLSGDQFGQQRVNSYVKLVPSERLAAMVARSAGTGLTTKQVASRLSADADVNTVLLTARVTDTSPQRSLQLAKAVSTQLVALVQQLESQGGRRASPVALDVVSGPELAARPVAPKPLKNVLAGLIAGLGLGVVAALVRDTLDNTVRSAEALRQVGGVPVLATVGHDRDAANAPLLVRRQNGTGGAEAFRQLRTGLQFASVDDPVKVLVVTSSTMGEGKSLTSANLALAFADAGSRVLLIEADLRRPRVADYFGLERSVGLSNVLAGQVALDDAVQPFGRGQLMVLASGSTPPNPSELLGTRNMVELLARVRQICDVVVIDTPPLLPVTDAAVVAAQADGTVLAVRYGSTKRNQVQQSMRSLQAVGATVLGTVLTMAPEPKGFEGDGYEDYESIQVDGPDPDNVPPDLVTRARRKALTTSGAAREPGPPAAPAAPDEPAPHEPAPAQAAPSGALAQVWGQASPPERVGAAPEAPDRPADEQDVRA